MPYRQFAWCGILGCKRQKLQFLNKGRGSYGFFLPSLDRFSNMIPIVIFMLHNALWCRKLKVENLMVLSRLHLKFKPFVIVILYRDLRQLIDMKGFSFDQCFFFFFFFKSCLSLSHNKIIYKY